MQQSTEEEMVHALRSSSSHTSTKPGPWLRTGRECRQRCRNRAGPQAGGMAFRNYQYGMCTCRHKPSNGALAGALRAMSLWSFISGAAQQVLPLLQALVVTLIPAKVGQEEPRCQALRALQIRAVISANGGDIRSRLMQIQRTGCTHSRALKGFLETRAVYATTVPGNRCSTAHSPSAT
ncbi:hypothetical protein KIL84_016262 [Mauremys mutica]|uniref:Uncharacterized protein n=1 Tax=Mauremys mutica TaxID=74926 RepID=A0A9D3WU42_9SAUR|nr:hypothetical protein KIL84_016262 [Mauremys mutica]